jgi:two-component system OmpR family response regulator
MIERASGGETILIVEEDRDVAIDLRGRLMTDGYVVRLATSAEEALVSLQTTSADLILLSLTLPDSDGLILCSSLRASTETPIIVLSGRRREVDRALALELGAVDVLIKPVDHDDLLARVESALPRSLSRRQDRSTAA